jgi:hypothetical protein
VAGRVGLSPRESFGVSVSEALAAAVAALGI